MADDVSRNERIKEASEYLRGTLAEGLREEITGAIVEDDQQLVKFHGMYLQDDRDLRPERTRKKMEKAFAFMIRVRVPGGVLSLRSGWRSTGSRRLRQPHHAADHATDGAVARRHQVESEGDACKQIDAALLNSIAACGDVNRNVMCNANPHQSRRTRRRIELAQAISDHLTPRTPAYREIWLDGERIAGGEEDVVEPIYGKTYLPRKFKIVVAVPPSNDVDVFAHDLGFIAILDDKGDIAGWNVTVGGGMGMTHGEPDTYPRTADVMGFCQTEDAVRIAEAVVTVQRDWGDRANRKHARLKYTIEDRGLDAFRAEVEKRAGVKLEAARPFTFTSTGDRYGWSEGADGHGHLTLFVQNGRVARRGRARSRCRRCARIAEMHDGDIPHHANQNLIVANVPTERQAEIERIARDARPAGAVVGPAAQLDGLRRAADLRPGAGRERTLSARSDRRRSTSDSRRTGCRPTTSSSA